MFDDDSINTVFLENVSPADPEVIFVRPNDKLVLEVRASGRYQLISWQINGAQLSSSTPQDLQYFSNHYEIYVVGEATEDDIGIYEVSLRAYNILSQRTSPSEIDFVVIPPCELFPVDIVVMNTFILLYSCSQYNSGQYIYSDSH